MRIVFRAISLFVLIGASYLGISSQEWSHTLIAIISVSAFVFLGSFVGRKTKQAFGVKLRDSNSSSLRVFADSSDSGGCDGGFSGGDG